jgi:hypothetical protein
VQTVAEPSGDLHHMWRAYLSAIWHRSSYFEPGFHHNRSHRTHWSTLSQLPMVFFILQLKNAYFRSNAMIVDLPGRLEIARS